ncbi:PQQ-dependent sugar dehydrogenase [Pyxidicoccus parkwayensis]|uniref:PQQ-dependent sugar dehydrogenase n=1 Tax=Pyxidicoccus parkwayensis TaxID=2813578 RepID=A0ABX7NRC0_9BACT|nr:PQQ-dependent sugar dehydrogenase [Pyxidicoccus parkwaysis]QSQ21419.1 PQQ-dependent sugar dehydrogenase [Pyxidicoccus parkwaysis]
MRSHLLLSLACLLCLASCAEPEPTVEPLLPESAIGQQRAATVPPSFTDTEVANNLGSPTAMAFAPDGRLFVCEQEGKLRVIQNGMLLAEPFVTVTTDDNGERGLLGVAFDPGFPQQPYVYVYYTSPSPVLRNRVSRFTANGNRAVSGSEVVLLELDPLTSASNHNGGALHFGRDGKLYIAVGDNARSANARELTTLKGKMLRINPDGSIPTDNPFVSSTTGVYRAIWAIGLRNPFSFAIQPGTGRMLINDVGASHWEEINVGVAGSNYGWPDTEGPTTDTRFRAPLYAYGHGTGNSLGCAITGGTLYNPTQSQFPSSYVGRYFFADYCGGWIRVLDPNTATTELFASGLDAPVDLAVGPEGSLYYLDRGRKSVHRIQYTPNGGAPVITTQPVNQRVVAGKTVTFSVQATGTAPLSYQWQHDGVDMPGKTGPSLSLSLVVLSDSGARLRVRVSNAAGSVLSNEAILTVVAGTAPVATILTPAVGSQYRATQVISFSGSGTDAEEGTLPASAFTWRVDFHHADHLHPFMPDTSGVKSGSFTIPDTGETSSDVWYRIHLTVKDSTGLTHEVIRDVNPLKVLLTLDSQPSGLQLTLDGQPLQAPAQVVGVVGMLRSLGVVSPQVKDGVTYVFSAWSDGPPATHDIHTPATDTRYTANFTASASSAGLRAEYFGTEDLTGAKVERVDGTVDFRWNNGAPMASLGPDGFSVRWTGSVVPQYSETYTFYTQSNDGVRLWVNGQLLIDNWTRHDTTENSGTISLQAGRAYSLRMEFFEHTGVATARLFWSSAHRSKQLIPADRLRTSSSAATP